MGKVDMTVVPHDKLMGIVKDGELELCAMPEAVMQAFAVEEIYKGFLNELVGTEDALAGGTVLVANQGQALDGFSALANFRDIAKRAKKFFESEASHEQT